MLITAEQIAPYRKTSDDYKETEQLKTYLADKRCERQPFYLTANELEKILLWKLRGQIYRGRERRKANTKEIIKKITGFALAIADDDDEYELELRINILCALRGVGVPVATAILALIFPEKYSTIDYRGWRQVFCEDKTTFSISDYKKYLKKIRKLADELDWPVQEVDLAIWDYDIKNS